MSADQNIEVVALPTQGNSTSPLLKSAKNK